MKIASRFDPKYSFEKCPFCKNISQNFLIIDDVQLACLVPSCGAVFVRKEFLQSLNVRELLENQAKHKDTTCDICGKLCKNKIGLTGHMRSHGK